MLVNFQLISVLLPSTFFKCLLFKRTSCCTELGKTAFSHYDPWAWNNFQKDLKLHTFVSIGEFKGIIKRVVLEACFC